MAQTTRFSMLKAALAVCLVASAIAFGISRYFIVVVSLTYFPWLALLGCTVVQIRFRFRAVDVLLAAGFAGLCLLFRWQLWNLPQPYKMLGALLGLGSLVVMAIRAVWAQKEERIGFLSALIPSLILVGSEWLTPPLLDLAQSRNPKTLDLYLLVFDATLRVQPAFEMGRLFERLPMLRQISIVFYLALPLLIALVYVEQLRRNRKTALVTLLIFFFTAILGAASYNFYPACGPISLLQNQFPRLNLTFAQASRLFLEAVPISGARNAMPSMHIAWVILALWLARNLDKWVKAICLLYVFFTFAATLGTGEHYFIDLIVALPFSLAMYALFALDVSLFRSERLWSLVGGLAGTAAWLILLRYQIPLFVKVPGLSWTLIAMTIAGVFYAQRQLSALRLDALQVETRRTDSISAVLPAQETAPL